MNAADIRMEEIQALLDRAYEDKDDAEYFEDYVALSCIEEWIEELQWERQQLIQEKLKIK